jgi:beta-N-acetylhexosaminidase
MEGAASAGNGVDRARAAINAGCDLLLVCNDRPMAKQVLQWMVEDRVPGSDAAISMLARKSWTDSEIIEHKNYALAAQFITKIEEASARV